jgi:hypothetical protein
MKNISITILLLLFTVCNVRAQTIVTELNGFRIGQFRETATNEYGKPIEGGKYEDDYEFDVFIIEPENQGLYMVFEYAASNKDIIWSIQVGGTNSAVDIGFKGLRLGQDKKEVQSVLGKPDKKEDVDVYGQKWSYDNTNYSIEFGKGGKLSSVKITNNYSSMKPDVNKLPKFEDVVKLLNSSSNAEIAGILSPGIEIYYKDKVMFFGKSFRTEIEKDNSKIYQTIREISKDLEGINTADLSVYEENIRIESGKNPKHVIKIKKDHVIKEIVLEYVNGQYVIWKISAQ